MRKENGKRAINKKTSIRFITLLVFIVMVVTSINSCGFLASASWKEEVKLSDGRIIVVKRRIIREGGGDEWVHNPTLSKPKEYRISFAYPDGSGKIVEWRSTKKDEAMYPERPLILDMESGQPMIFSIVSISTACMIYSKYLYRDGIWIEEKLPEKFEKLTTNLFLIYDVNIPKFIDLETKRKQSYYGSKKSYRQVGPNREVCR